MKKTYQKLSLVPLDIKVETGILQESIKVQARGVTVVPYEDGFKGIESDGFTEDGGYTINF